MSTEPVEMGMSGFASVGDFALQRAQDDARNEARCALVPSRILMRVLVKRYVREVLDNDDDSAGDTDPFIDGVALYECAYDLAQEDGFENAVNDFSDHLDAELCQEVLDEKRRST